MDIIKSISISLVEHVYFKFKNRCHFYDLQPQEVLSFMIEKFIDGDFDEELNIKQLVDH